MRHLLIPLAAALLIGCGSTTVNQQGCTHNCSASGGYNSGLHNTTVNQQNCKHDCEANGGPPAYHAPVYHAPVHHYHPRVIYVQPRYPVVIHY